MRMRVGINCRVTTPFNINAVEMGVSPRDSWPRPLSFARGSRILYMIPQKHYTVTAGLYIQASPLTLWDWKSKGARELAVTVAIHRTEKHHTDSRTIDLHTSITSHTVDDEFRIRKLLILSN